MRKLQKISLVTEFEQTTSPRAAVMKARIVVEQTDLLTAIATACDQLEAIATKQTPTTTAQIRSVVRDLERLVMELQKGE